MITRSLSRAISRSITRGLSEALGGFSPASLFSLGEQGVWYDPSDLSTLFQDTAGTIPVTAAGQPVGLMLDKSKGLARSAELFPDSDFSSGSTSGWATANSGSMDVVGEQFIVTNDIASSAFAYRSIPTVVGKTYEVRIDVVGATSSWHVRLGDNTSATTNPKLITTGTTAGKVITGIFTATSGTTFVRLGTNDSTLDSAATFDLVSIKELSSIPATQATAAARPILQQDARGRYYLNFDGTDDSIAAGNLDMTSTDEMTTCAGIRKVTPGAGGGMLLEHGTGLAPQFAMFCQTSDKYQFSSGGTVSIFAVSPSAYISPHTAVLTGTAKISTPLGTLRVNGAQVSSSVGSQGTGNYGNLPLYVGRRTSSALPFNGALFGLVIRGKTCTAQELADLENWMNTKTGAY